MAVEIGQTDLGWFWLNSIQVLSNTIEYNGSEKINTENLYMYMYVLHV